MPSDRLVPTLVHESYSKGKQCPRIITNKKKFVKHHRIEFLNLTVSYALKLIVLSSESLLASFYLQ